MLCSLSIQSISFFSNYKDSSVKLSVCATLSKLKSILMIEFFVFSLVKRITNLLHQFIIKIQIVKHCKTHTERFLSLKEMAYVRARIITASRTITAG